MIVLTSHSIQIRKLTLTAVFLSLALILKTYFSIYIPMFGQNGMRIGVAGVFTALPAILFGPFYGMLASGLTDLLGHFLKPAGAYMPLLTLTACLGGFLRGLFWMLLRNCREKTVRIAVVVLVVCAAVFGLWNIWALSADGVDAGFYDRLSPGAAVDTDNMRLISRMLITRTANVSDPGGSLATYINFTTAGPVGFSIFGAVMLVADFVLSKRMTMAGQKGSIIKILLALLLAGMIVTTLNTVILREMFFASWKVLPFSVLWLPRAIEELIANTVNAYMVAILYGILLRQPALHRMVFPTSAPVAKS
ncbi:folate family ECF transporter S component [Ruminococcaceae bacterium OttesenSCG-928-L11]|nr:folate family ECF transporter S component [Ruminococcaceae bacterium OttesenSCG-928-L11]